MSTRQKRNGIKSERRLQTVKKNVSFVFERLRMFRAVLQSDREKETHYLSRRGCQAPCTGTSQKDQLDVQHSPCCATHSALQGGVFHPALKLLLSVASTSLANKKAKSLQLGGWREREGKEES